MTIADRMDVVADGLEDIGQVDWAATLREIAAEVRVLEIVYRCSVQPHNSDQMVRIEGLDRVFTLNVGNGGTLIPSPLPTPKRTADIVDMIRYASLPLPPRSGESHEDEVARLRADMIRERGDIARALDLPTWGTTDHY